MKPDLCIYHADCADGFGAALAVKLYCEQKGSEVEFVPMQYGQPITFDIHDRKVIIVDFSYPRSILEDMFKIANGMMVIDHHKTAQADLKGLFYCVFDMNKSGAVLTWETLFPGIEIPLLFQYIQDRDLWQWKMDYSREVSAALRSYPMDFEIWRKYLSSAKMASLVDDGTAILRYQIREVENAVKKQFNISIAGYIVPCLNATTLISEIGEALCDGSPFSATYFDTTDKRIFSLRSNVNGIDVSTIAKKFGGGGHAHAAGFSMAIEHQALK